MWIRYKSDDDDLIESCKGDGKTKNSTFQTCNYWSGKGEKECLKHYNEAWISDSSGNPYKSCKWDPFKGSNLKSLTLCREGDRCNIGGDNLDQETQRDNLCNNLKCNEEDDEDYKDDIDKAVKKLICSKLSCFNK